jgi:hypothetical protein
LTAVDYLRDVKPLLEHKCYACHGAFKQQAGLRLDTAVALKKGGDSGSPIDARDPRASLLLAVLTGEAGFRMPPENEGAPLTPEERDLIRQWLEAGAPAPDDEQPQDDPRSWWSYRPLSRPEIPEVADDTWCRTAIDRFVEAGREQQQMPHVGEVSPAGWLRRVFLDLIGLPPTRSELHRFLADDSPTAYEAVVDDLLARPQYGERWGRHWMDIWRYSDWYGSRGNNEIRYSQRHIWRWRDWIVRSLNADQGYDQMIRQMLAADEIAGDHPDILPATGYLGRNWYKFDRDVWMFDTVERTSEALLGLTLRCARCHDHKFDPVSQEEYYRFRAFFEPHQVRTDPISLLTATQKDATLGQVLTDGIALVYDKELDVPTYRFERGDSRNPDKTKPLTPAVPAALGGDKLMVSAIDLPVEAWYPALRPGVRETIVEKSRLEVASAEKEQRDAESAARAAQERVRAAIERAGTSPSEPRTYLDDDFSKARPEIWDSNSGTWVYENNRLVQTAVTNFATMVTKSNHPSDFKVHLRYRTLEPGSYRSVGFSFDYQDQGNSQDVYTSVNDKRPSVQAFHRTKGKQVYPPAGMVAADLQVGDEITLDVEVLGSRLVIELNGERKLEYTLPIERREGKFALWVHEGSAEFLELRIVEQAESVETLERRQKEAERAVTLANAKVSLARAQLVSVEKRLAASLAMYLGQNGEQASELARQACAAEQQANVLHSELELAQLSGRDMTDDERKQFEAAQERIRTAREALANPTETFTPLGEQYPKTSTGRRAALAAWIASPANPRTVRVAANHLWGRHFGVPLVATPENFGPNGRKPTHPELLDWLAAELIAHNWNMKPLHRQIVLSSTYRMSAAAAGAESALAADPENHSLWRMNTRRMEAEVVRDSTLYLADRLDLQLGGPEIPETSGESVLRRSLYFRNTPNEKMLALEVFDVADPNSCYRRKESVVPQQSLAMMNSGLALDHARMIAEQIAGDDDELILAGFETILTRPPSGVEWERCRRFLSEQARQSIEQDAPTFPQGGTARRGPAADPRKRARENLIHVLLLHNDFVTIR